MAKKKKRGKRSGGSHVQRSIAMAENFNKKHQRSMRLFDVLLSEPEQDGYYARKLHISAETGAELRKLERPLNWLERMVYRAYMTKPVKDLAFNFTRARMQAFDEYSREFDSTNPENVFRTLLMTFLATNCLSLESPPDDVDKIEYLTEGIRGILAKVPTKFVVKGRINDIAQQYTKALQPVSVLFFQFIDWEKVTAGNNVCFWAKNAMSIIEPLLGESDKEDFDEEREHVLLSFAEHAAPALSPLTRSALTAWADRATDPEAADFVRFATSYLNAKPGDPPPDWTFGNTKFICSAVMTSVYDYSTMALLSAWPDIWREKKLVYSMAIYTAMSFLAEYPAYDETPAVLQHIFHSLCCVSPLNLFSPHVKKSNRHLTASLYMPYETTNYASSWAELVQENMSILSATYNSRFLPRFNEAEWGYNNITPAQLFYQETGLVPEETIEIPLDYSRLLEKMGYSKNVAFAICGYLSGWKHALCTDFIMPHHEVPSDTIDKAAETYATLTESVQRDALAKAQEMLHEEIERANLNAERSAKAESKANREARFAAHSLEEAQRTVAELTAALEDAKEENARLMAEQNSLQTLVTDLTPKAEEPEDTTAEELPAFPLDIAKDYSFVVYGGPQNWVNAQQQRFPNITFIDGETKPDEKVITNADVLLLNIFIMHHKNFDNIQKYRQKAKKGFDYLKTRGINRGSLQIIETDKAYRAALGSGE